MDKRLKRTVLILIGIFITYMLGSFIFSVKTGYNVDFDNFKDKLWLFNPKLQKEVDTFLYVEDYRKSDSYTTYNLGGATIGIHEIYDLERIKLSSIKFNKITRLNNTDFYPAQILNRSVNVIPTIRTYWNQSFDNNLSVSFNGKTQIDSIVRGENYICYHAHIDKMLFRNGENKEMMFFDFSEKSRNTLLLFLKKRNRFFIIMVNSSKDFGMEVLNIFDL